MRYSNKKVVFNHSRSLSSSSCSAHISSKCVRSVVISYLASYKISSEDPSPTFQWTNARLAYIWSKSLALSLRYLAQAGSLFLNSNKV